MENMQEFSDLIKGKYLPSESQKLEACADFYRKLLIHEMETEVVDACKDACTTTVYKGELLEHFVEQAEFLKKMIIS